MIFGSFYVNETVSSMASEADWKDCMSKRGYFLPSPDRLSGAEKVDSMICWDRNWHTYYHMSPIKIAINIFCFILLPAFFLCLVIKTHTNKVK